MLNIELIESDQGRSHELDKGFFFGGGCTATVGAQNPHENRGFY